MTTLTEWIDHLETAAVAVDDAATAVPSSASSARRRRRRAWILLVILVVVACGTAVFAAKRPAIRAQSPTATLTSGFVTYADPSNHFRISYPRGWNKATDSDGGLVIRADDQTAVGVRVFTLASNVNTRNLQDMQAVTDAVLSAPSAHLTVLASQVVHVGQLTGLYYLYNFPSGGQQGVHAHYFLFSGNRMFTLVFQAVPASGFQALAKTFDGIAHSFTATPD